MAGADEDNPESWGLPLCSVIVAHHNYSEYAGECLKSLIHQTHQRFECVVVDDASTESEYETLRAVVDEIADPRIRLIRNAENIGQVPSFFRGLDETRGEFVCLLDPDDCYVPQFLEQMVGLHLNDYVYAPIACCDQALRRAGAIFSPVQTCTTGETAVKAVNRFPDTGRTVRKAHSFTRRTAPAGTGRRHRR